MLNKFKINKQRMGTARYEYHREVVNNTEQFLLFFPQFYMRVVCRDATKNNYSERVYEYKTL